MRILLAPDKFKGTFTAREVCRHLRDGILAADPFQTVASHPLADGGDGTLDVLLSTLGGERISVQTTGPLGSPWTAEVGRLEDGTVIVESALFCGLGTIPASMRNPARAGTYGLGAALATVVSWRPPHVVVGLGGSATVDGGIGLARAFGYQLLDSAGRPLLGTGADLMALASIRRPRAQVPADGIDMTILCDVVNPLTGPMGAAAVFAPQKGATEEDVLRLGAGLENLERILHRDLGVDIHGWPGGGAAGGLAAGMKSFLGAAMEPGARYIMDKTGFLDALVLSDLVVTGEGACSLEDQKGKVVSEVVAAAESLRVPVVIVCGSIKGLAKRGGVRVIEGGEAMSAADLENAGKSLVLQRLS